MTFLVTDAALDRDVAEDAAAVRALSPPRISIDHALAGGVPDAPGLYAVKAG